jgi:four helix bundle protein
MADPIKSYNDLRVFQNAMDAAMKIYRLTAKFPSDERHAMTEQMRQTSRSVCSNLAKAWRKRGSKDDFIAKLSSAESQVCASLVWVEFARRCNYLGDNICEELNSAYDLILGQISKMINEPYKWLVKSASKRQTNEKTSAKQEETVDA